MPMNRIINVLNKVLEKCILSPKVSYLKLRIQNRKINVAVSFVWNNVKKNLIRSNSFISLENKNKILIITDKITD